jgi:hypothetical protein
MVTAANKLEGRQVRKGMQSSFLLYAQHFSGVVGIVGVRGSFEWVMLYGASTFFALQIRHARFRTLPSARTTSGANSMPNI